MATTCFAIPPCCDLRTDTGKRGFENGGPSWWHDTKYDQGPQNDEALLGLLVGPHQSVLRFAAKLHPPGIDGFRPCFRRERWPVSAPTSKITV